MTKSLQVDANGNRRTGDHEGVGSFTAMVAGSDLCYGYTVAGIDTPVAAHIIRRAVPSPHPAQEPAPPV